MPPAASLEAVTLHMGVRNVLDDVSLEVPAGSITALVGPNGCGKSTIVRMLCGFLFPTRGTVHILGGRLGRVNVHELRAQVKLVQPTMLHEPEERMTVREVVLTGAFGTIDLHDEPTEEHQARASALLPRLRLSRVADSAFRTCSTGERMRTQLARALMSKPKLLILDEPTAGLDLPMREQLLMTLDAIHAADDSPAILLVTHHLEEIPPSASHVILMTIGRVLTAGTPREVLKSDAMSTAFSYPIAVTRTEDGRFYAHAKGSAIE